MSTRRRWTIQLLSCTVDALAACEPRYGVGLRSLSGFLKDSVVSWDLTITSDRLSNNNWKQNSEKYSVYCFKADYSNERLFKRMEETLQLEITPAKLAVRRTPGPNDTFSQGGSSPARKC